MRRAGAILYLFGLLVILPSPAWSSTTPVGFGVATSGACLLNSLDDPSPVNGVWAVFGSGAIQVLPGGFSITTRVTSCKNPVLFPIVTWGTGSESSARILVRYHLEASWSEPEYLEGVDFDPLADVPSVGTLRLSKAVLAEESAVMSSTPGNQRSASERPSRLPSELPLDGPPAFFENPITQVPMVVWARNSGRGFDIVSAAFRNGSWSEPKIVSASREDELDPQLVVAPDGVVHLFYWTDGPAARVLHRWANADLSRWSKPQTVSQPGEFASHPSGAFHDGRLVVAYEVRPLGSRATSRNIVLAFEDGPGFRSQVVGVSQSPGPVMPRVHSEDGLLWVDWNDGAGASGWTRLDERGNWERPQYEPWGTSIEREQRGQVRTRVQGGDLP